MRIGQRRGSRLVAPTERTLFLGGYWWQGCDMESTGLVCLIVSPCLSGKRDRTPRARRVCGQNAATIGNEKANQQRGKGVKKKGPTATIWHLGDEALSNPSSWILHLSFFRATPNNV